MDWNDHMDVPADEGLFSPPPSFRTNFHVQSPCCLLANALGSNGRVDFPTVTEICYGVEGDSNEMAAVARMLSSELQRESSPVSSKLKALTVAHELLYDADARQALKRAPGLLVAIKNLRTKHLCETDCTGGPAEDCVRLLASEICNSLDVNICRL